MLRRLIEGMLKSLLMLFDKLESVARQIMGAGASLSKESEEESEEEEEGGKKLRMFKELRPVFREIDSKIAEILGVYVDVDELWRYAWEMMERRIKGAGRKVAPGAEGVELALFVDNHNDCCKLVAQLLMNPITGFLKVLKSLRTLHVALAMDIENLKGIKYS